LGATDVTIGQASPPERDQHGLSVLEALPVAIYTTDATGKITFYNQAAVDFAGRRPQLGRDKWCVTWRLYQPDGTPLPHNACPMAVALKERRPVRGEEAVAERPDGTRIPFRAYPTPMFNGAGELTGAINLLMDISNQKRVQAEAVQIKSLLAVEEQSNPLTMLIRHLRSVVASDTDPYLLAGALIEGVAITIAEKIPHERHGEVSVEAVRLLRDRMRGHGLI
jgi:PAS domain S-box-containing protein